MNIFIFYFDKLTSWLDLSWFITRKKKEDELVDKEETPTYMCYEPLLS